MTNREAELESEVNDLKKILKQQLEIDSLGKELSNIITISKEQLRLEKLLCTITEFITKWENKSERDRNTWYNDCASINDMTNELSDIIEEYKGK